MANWSSFTKLHRAVYERSDGRWMTRLVGLDMLLLTTTGRKSGQLRTLPLACMKDGDDLVVVGSNNGQDRDPAWWLNLQTKPEARVRFKREVFAARAERAEGAEYDRLWPLLKQYNPHYAKYEQKTARPIPVVVLKRTTP
jgi:deazaflavin-dependent oxidoreductase (nitroreductase family)